MIHKSIVLATALLLTNAQGVRAAENTPHELSSQQAIEQLESFINDQAEADKFSGTVLLSKNGETLYSAAHGLASKRFNVPNNLETKLNLGSMNKMFTSVAIMQLAEDGKIALTDTIDKYVGDDWLEKEISQQIQIQHLLTHASGLGSYFNADFRDGSRLRFRNLEDFKPLVKGDTPQFTPGTAYRYSNTGMLLLGVIIEAASGQSYYDYVRDRIYSPTQMSLSGCYDMDQPIQNLAIGYHPSSKNDTGWVNNYLLHVVKGGPAGGCFSTVGDLQRFAEALTGHQLLSKESTDRLLSPKPEFHSENYGFGFRLSGTDENRIVGHSGGFFGISANLDVFLDKGYVAVVLSNYSGASRPIRDKIRELIEAISE